MRNDRGDGQVRMASQSNELFSLKWTSQRFQAIRENASYRKNAEPSGRRLETAMN